MILLPLARQQEFQLQASQLVIEDITPTEKTPTLEADNRRTLDHRKALLPDLRTPDHRKAHLPDTTTETPKVNIQVINRDIQEQGIKTTQILIKTQDIQTGGTKARVLEDILMHRREAVMVHIIRQQDQVKRIVV